jgi:hypothetical protein
MGTERYTAEWYEAQRRKGKRIRGGNLMAGKPMTADLRKMAREFYDSVGLDYMPTLSLEDLLARVRSEALEQAARVCDTSLEMSPAVLASRIRALDPKGAAGR